MKRPRQNKMQQQGLIRRVMANVYMRYSLMSLVLATFLYSFLAYQGMLNLKNYMQVLDVSRRGDVPGVLDIPLPGADTVTQGMNVSTTPEPAVPKFVHLVWFFPENTTFRFHHLMCILSIQRHLGPKRVIVWYNNEPRGPWWAFARQTLPSMGLMRVDPPTLVHDRAIGHPEHQSDVTRLDVLLKYGGIYMDFDVIVLKGFDSLLQYDVTMGAESPDLLGNGIILAKPNATFLELWKNKYRDFDDSKFNHHSVKVPMMLAKTYPHLVHIEWFSLLRPNWNERDWIFTEGKLWDWSDNYAIHLYYRAHSRDYDPIAIRTLNSTVGEIFRFVYYGKPDLLVAG